MHVLKYAVTPLQSNISTDTDDNDDCDIYVAVYADDFGKESSCIQLDRSNKSVAVIDLRVDCIVVTTPPTPVISNLPTSSPLVSPPTPHCFSGLNLVEVKDVGIIPMNQLRIGDFVRSGGTSSDQFSMVYGFGHMSHIQEAKYLRFLFLDKSDGRDNTALENNASSFVEISPMHLIFVDKNMKQILIRAADVKVGDQLNRKQVIEIQIVMRHGLYAPLTYSGVIVVNGILASNYVDVLDYHILWNQHTCGHFIFSPQRLFCSYFIETCKKEIYINGYGIFAYVIIMLSWFINKFQAIIRMLFQFN
jgi:Hint module